MFGPLETKMYLLTKDNWGFPWHILIAHYGFQILRGYLPVNWAFTIVFLLGLFNELYQLWKAKKTGDKKKMRRQKRDSWQDMIANFIGLFSGFFW